MTMPIIHKENISDKVWNDLNGLKLYKKDLENDLTLIPGDKDLMIMLRDVELRIFDLKINRLTNKG
jgi:hypothetical protein